MCLPWLLVAPPTGFFTEAEWRDTANALGADVVMLDGIGHQPMWEEGGRRLIDEIDAFVSSLSHS